MTKWGRHRTAIGALLVATATVACGAPQAPVSTPRAAAPATPAASAPASAARVDARAPTVVDRGAEPVAIVRSLLRFGRWLEGEHPDPALVDRAYAWGTDLARGVRAQVTTLRRTGRRVIEVDAAPPEFVVASRLPTVVSFRVIEHLARRDLVDAHGRVLDHVGPAVERYVVLIHRFSAEDPWRLSAVDRRPPSVEVAL